MSNASKKKKIIAHPILFALYPILFLYAHNIKEAYISQIFFPLLFSIVFASLLWGGLFLAVKDKVKSAIISTIFIFLFFLYGHIFDQLAIEKSQLPDIYYIILDGYASLSTIKTLYHYDDTSFARELKELEFYIAGESRTQYKMTEQSLASSLNMCYTEKEDNFYAMIRDNQVVEILKKAGYKIIAFLDKDEIIFYLAPNLQQQKTKEYAMDVSEFSNLYQSPDPEFYKGIPEYDMLKRGMTKEERIRNGYYAAYRIAEELEGGL